MKSFIIKIILFSSLFLVVSCDITKQAFKNKSEASGKESIETVTKRKGDTVTYTIPNVILKDTIVYTVNRQGTTLRTVYDQTGSISSIDCFASAIEEIKKENREFQESIKEKEKQKTEDFDSSFILYIVSAIVILGIFALLLLFFFINKNTKAVTEVLNRLSK
jgi:hypothetical protein